MSFVIVSGGICCSLQYLDSPPPKPVLYRNEPEHVFVANLIYVKYCMYTWPTISSKTIYSYVWFLTWYYKIYTFYDRKFKSDWLIDHIVHMFLGLLINKHVNSTLFYFILTRFHAESFISTSSISFSKIYIYGQFSTNFSFLQPA